MTDGHAGSLGLTSDPAPSHGSQAGPDAALPALHPPGGGAGPARKSISTGGTTGWVSR
jgi:hypothetical protein